MKKLSSVLKWLGIIILGLHIIPILTILCVAMLYQLADIFYTEYSMFVVYPITMLSSLSVFYVVFKRLKSDTQSDTQSNVALSCAFGVNVLILILIICRCLVCTPMYSEYLKPVKLFDIVMMLGFSEIVICNELCKGTFKRYKERRKNFWGVVLSIFMGIAVIIIFFFIADYNDCLYSNFTNSDMKDDLIGDIIPIRVNLLALLSLYLCMFVYNVYKFNKRDKVVQDEASLGTEADSIAFKEN
ncbi:MAG: hypothetical protein J6K74_07540 [Marinifilaceae bacterium]|nr:hypothetical protein [Marinifilaceae bacterium]